MKRSRVCGHSAQCYDGCSNTPSRLVACIGFVVPGVHTSELFDFAEIVFDEVPPFVSLLIVWNMDLAIALGRNDGDGTAFMQNLAQMISIESLVCHQDIEHESVDQVWYTNDLTALTWQQFETNEIAQGIRERKDFGC
jgi:hypothetical protein